MRVTTRMPPWGGSPSRAGSTTRHFAAAHSRPAALVRRQPLVARDFAQTRRSVNPSSPVDPRAGARRAPLWVAVGANPRKAQESRPTLKGLNPPLSDFCAACIPRPWTESTRTTAPGPQARRAVGLITRRVSAGIEATNPQPRRGRKNLESVLRSIRPDPVAGLAPERMTPTASWALF